MSSNVSTTDLSLNIENPKKTINSDVEGVTNNGADNVNEALKLSDVENLVLDNATKYLEELTEKLLSIKPQTLGQTPNLRSNPTCARHDTCSGFFVVGAFKEGE